MKKRQFHFIMAGTLVLGVIISSCTKEKDLEFSDNLTQTDNGLLKSFMVKSVTLSSIEQLGKNIFYDKISVPNSMACADCHSPSVGFTGANVGTNIHGSVYRGANGSFGNRKPPSAAYATFSPILHEDGGVFVGGNFWDGRATGERLRSPSAEQALGPFLNPAEHNVPDKLTVLQKIAKSKYVSMWKTVWGAPLSLTTDKINLNYDRVGLAIAAYEGSSEVNQFSSKFDYSLQGLVLTSEEESGLKLFNTNCASCHISESIDGIPPLFTDFTFDNLGVPKNPENPVYDYNPGFIDKGLGGFLENDSNHPKWASLATENMGKQKVPTLRNVDKRPGIGFTKAYMHNGVFKSLKEVVHFYNTSDDKTWPAPEVSANINTNVGNMGLTDAEEDAIVAFLKTLSDGYVK